MTKTTAALRRTARGMTGSNRAAPAQRRRGRYGPIRALRNVSLAVDQGEIVALLGANGAGKLDHPADLSPASSSSSRAVVFDG